MTEFAILRDDSTGKFYAVRADSKYDFQVWIFSGHVGTLPEYATEIILPAA